MIKNLINKIRFSYLLPKKYNNYQNRINITIKNLIKKKQNLDIYVLKSKIIIRIE